jgi:hypothetical protein
MNVNRVFLYLSNRWRLVAILILAFAIRAALALLSDSFNHPDENFQIMEQAHRLVFGYGIIPWEYRLAARSWLVPGFMALFLYPFKLLGLDDPNIYIPGVKILFSILSLTIVWAAYRIGKELLSEKAGLVAAFVCAVWYEIIYFSIRPLSEVWATVFFLAALALSFSNKKREIIWSAIFTIMVAAIRINYLPIAAILGIISFIRLNPTSRRYYLASSIATMIMIGVFEYFTLGKPFISYYHFLDIDRSFFMSGAVGSTFSFAYLLKLAQASYYIYWVIPVLGLIFFRHTKLLMVLIAVALLTHILIPARDFQIDYRHIYIVIPPIMITGAIVLHEFLSRINNLVRRRMIFSMAIIFLFCFSLAGAMIKLPGQNEVYRAKTIPVYDHDIFYRDPRLAAYRFLNACPDMAGLYDISEQWFRSGGYYYLHNDIPIYFASSTPLKLEYVSHILSREPVPTSSGFELIKQFENYRIYARANKNFPYKRDLNYTKNIMQPGIDDRLKSKI